MASSAPDHDREYRLIEQLELRIASANTDEKFESIIQKFLAALVLKLAAENPRNRNLAIKVCQYINQRLKIDSSISLPVSSLLKTFREAENAFVKRFALMFIEQGLNRLNASDAQSILQDVLRSSIPQDDTLDPSNQKMWSLSFDFLLTVLQQWQIPDHATKEDSELRDAFNLTDIQCANLSTKLGAFLLYDPKVASSTSETGVDFQPVFEKYFQKRPNVVLPIAKLLFSAIFEDKHRLIPATILSVDANAPASSLADAMFKQCSFDLESAESVDALFTLFKASKPKLQTRILALLGRSQKSTEYPETILDIVEKQLFRDTTGLEAAKLRAAVFSYLTWAVRVSKSLKLVKEKLQAALREFIEQQGWPTIQTATAAENDLRAKAYESIGLLATIQSIDGATNRPQLPLDLVTWLFTSLRCDTTRDIRGSIDEALSRLLNGTVVSSGQDELKLKELLLWSLTAAEGSEDPLYFQPTKNNTSYISVRYANKCLSFADVDARYIDILALCVNDRREVAEEANRGLDPYWHTSGMRLSSHSVGKSGLKFPPFSEFTRKCFLDQSARENVVKNSNSLSAAVLFARNLLITEGLKDTAHDDPDKSEWRSKIDAIMKGDKSARDTFKTYTKKCDQEALLSLTENAIFGMSIGSTICADITLELCGLISDRVIRQLRPVVLQWCLTGLSNPDTQLQSSRIVGIIASASDKGTDLAEQSIVQCSGWSSSIGTEAVKVRGSFLAATFTVTRSILRHSSYMSNDIVQRLSDLIVDIILSGRDKELVHAAYTALGQLSLCFAGHKFIENKRSQIIEHLLADAKKETEAAVAALGRLLNATHLDMDEDEAKDVYQRIFALHEIRKPEFHFAVGEALAVATLGFHSSSTITEFDIDAPISDSGIHADLFQSLLDRCIDDARNTKPSLRKATAIWLLCLIQYCDRAGLLQSRLRDCQGAFGRLLTDRDEIVQEAGSRGLGLVYEKGDKDLRDDLVRDLVQSFTGGSAKMSGTVDESTQLFEAGALPTEAGQSVTTYKDIVSLATEMGDPSLVYRFMNLASNNAIWSSRAAFGRFGLSGVLAESAYLTENKKFYPKLFRYRFDPNPNVQKSMDDIWKALVKDPTKVIDENFDMIMEDLLKSILSGKEWRAREASCGAIADLIQGQEVDKFEKYLDEIWKVAFKVLDDVKLTVRTAAMKLCRTLTSMLIRNLEIGQGTTKRAATMLDHGLPFLLQQMDGSSGQEVQQYAIVTLLEVVKKSPPSALQTFAPLILETLVLSLSSLEHESINYLHLNADKYGLTAEKLDDMRVSSINASPVTDAIERCLDSLSTTQTDQAADEVSTLLINDAMTRLEKSFKSAIGLPSKVGLSRVMVTLVVRHRAMFRPFADRFTQLTRKSILDRNATISISFSMALAYLVRLASGKEVQETIGYAQKLYFESQELAHRAVAGEIVQAISKASNDVFMRSATSFLPFAFIGRNDLDEGVRQRFEPPWKDNVGGSRSLNLYFSEMVELMRQHITSNLWPIRQACCLAAADLVSSMAPGTEYSAADAQRLWPLIEEALNGKTWVGKEKVILAYPKFVKQARSIWAQHDKRLQTLATREAKRTNIMYRRHAIAALGEFALVRDDLDFSGLTLSLLSNVADGLDSEDDAMDIDGEEISQARLTEETWASLVKCGFQALSQRSSPDDLDLAMTLLRKAHDKHLKIIDLEIYDGATGFITQINMGLSGSARPKDVGAESGQGRPDGDQAEREKHEKESTRGTEGKLEAAERGSLESTRLAPFFHNLVLALLVEDASRHSSEPEKIRKSRVDLAVAAAQSTILPPATCQLVTPVLQGWSRSERSRPLKMDLEKAVDMLVSSRSDQV